MEETKEGGIVDLIQKVIARYQYEYKKWLSLEVRKMLYEDQFDSKLRELAMESTSLVPYKE